MGSAGSNAGLLSGGTCLPNPPILRRSHDKVLKQFNAKMCLAHPARMPRNPLPLHTFFCGPGAASHTLCFFVPFFALFSTCAHNGNELEL